MKMKLSLAISTTCLTGLNAFNPSPQSNHASISSRALFSYSSRTLGFDTSDLYTEDERLDLRNRGKMMEYIREIRSQVILRPNLGNRVLVSGFDPVDPSASMVLDFLNNEDATYFPFEKIVAHVEDIPLAKKRMIGRNARYTGLLDKLDFSCPDKANDNGALIPSVEQLENVSSWVVHIGGGDLSQVNHVIEAAEAAPSVKNVAILVSGAQSVSAKVLKEAEKSLEQMATSFSYTLVVVPEWNNEPEALCAYGIMNVTDVAETGPFLLGETFSREESLRIVTECLAIDKAAGKCLVAKSYPDKKSVENIMIQSMREVGCSRIEEIEVMVTKGSKDCLSMMEAKDKALLVQREMRSPEEIAAQEALQAKAKEERMKRAAEEALKREKQEKLEEMARDWAKREYFRKSLKAKIPLSQEQFAEVVWDRAIFESSLKQRTMDGLSVNESEERQRFKEEQKKKKAAQFAEHLKSIDTLEYSELDTVEG